MSDDQRSYFQARAEEEIEAAQSASHPEAARAHYLLAGYYLDLVHNLPIASDERVLRLAFTYRTLDALNGGCLLWLLCGRRSFWL